MDDSEQKISQVEAFMVLAPLAVLDVVDIALLFAGLDDFFIIDAAAFPLTQFYFRMKGVRANYMLTSNLLELVPYMGKLPMRTIGAAVTIRAANRPEGLIAEAVSVGSSVVRKKMEVAHKASEGEAVRAEGVLKTAKRAEPQTSGVSPDTASAERQAAEARQRAEEERQKFKHFEMLRQQAATERGEAREMPEQEVVRPPNSEEEENRQAA